MQDVLFLVTGSPAQSASEYPVMCFKVLFKSFGFSAGNVRLRFSSRVPFKNLSTFLARVKSASVGDASLYDKHFCREHQSGLTPVMYCSFPTTAVTMNVELDHTSSSHRADSCSSGPSKASSLPLHCAVEQCPSIRQRTWQSVSL